MSRPPDHIVEAVAKGCFVEAEDTRRLKPRKRQSKQRIGCPPPSGAGAMRTETSVLELRLQDQTFPLLAIRPLNSINYTRLLLNLGTTSIYKLIKSGTLDARKLGNQTRITGESIKAFIDALPKGVAESPQPEGRRHSETGGSTALRSIADRAVRHSAKPPVAL